MSSETSGKVGLDGVPLDTASLKAVDQEILGRVQQALAASGVFALRELTVECVDDKLCLSGTVGSFYHKQLAQETVRPNLAGRRLLNCIVVN